MIKVEVKSPMQEVSNQITENNPKTEEIKPDLSKKEELYLPEIFVNYDNIPSKGKPYPKGSWIKYKPYVFGEILSYNQSEYGKVETLEFIAKGIEASFNKYDIAYFDFIFIALLRRLATFETNSFTIYFTCPKCGKTGSVVKNISDIEFKDLEVEVPISVNISLTDKPEILKFMPLTVGKYIELFKMGKNEDLIAIQAMQVINLPFEEAYNKIYNAFGGIKDLFNEVDYYLFFGTKPMEITCTARIEGGKEDERCGHQFFRELEDPNVLVQPFRESRESLRNRIQFGD